MMAGCWANLSAGAMVLSMASLMVVTRAQHPAAHWVASTGPSLVVCSEVNSVLLLAAHLVEYLGNTKDWQTVDTTDVSWADARVC